eukprot:3093998-Pyramimonas_sp.AAC.2
MGVGWTDADSALDISASSRTAPIEMLTCATRLASFSAFASCIQKYMLRSASVDASQPVPYQTWKCFGKVNSRLNLTLGNGKRSLGNVRGRRVGD